MEFCLRPAKTPAFPQEVLKDAYAMPTAAYTPYTRVNTHSELGGSTALLYEVLAEHYHPGLKVDGEESNLAYVLRGLRSLISSGKEPAMKVGPIWGHPMTASAFAVAKATPAIWNQLSDEEKEKIDWLMRAFVVTCSWATADQNDYRTGPCLAGNYSKHWNPNHISPSVIPILMAVSYFGSADTVNGILTDFSYDDFMATFQRLEFTNILRTWSAAGKMLFETGGDCYLQNCETLTPAGHGKGVKFPYIYRGMPLADTDAIFRELLDHNTRGGKVVNRIEGEGGQCAYQPTGESPVTGRDGMMTEFNSHDAFGIRSDVNYCACNFSILMPSLTAGIALGLWDPASPANAETSERTVVSITDFFYKLFHGYVSFSKGKPHVFTEENGVHGGYRFAKALWLDALGGKTE